MTNPNIWIEAEGKPGMKVVLISVILGVGSVLRLLLVPTPLDYRLDNSWRQADYAQIARNFFREGMNPLYPKIDWRGESPGYVEMELPALPWLAAVGYKIIGPQIQVARGISAGFEIAALFIFCWLCFQLLPRAPGVVALTLYTANPILLLISGSLQPDPVMDFFILAAVASLLLWIRHDRPHFLIASGALTGLAIAAKLPALYLGPVLAIAVLRHYGARCFFRVEVYLAGVLSLLPPSLWYAWSHHFWIDYGNSLGVSNESHFLGIDMLIPPDFLLGILKWEVFYVLSPLGMLLAILALFVRRSDWPLGWLPSCWYLSAWLFFLTTGPTSGDHWSYYYHSIAVAPAALLMGAGYMFLTTGRFSGDHRKRWASTAAVMIVVLSVVALLGIALRRRAILVSDEDMKQMFDCTKEFSSLIPESALIVVRGGPKFDDWGRAQATNQSMIFAWADRKGFNYPNEDLDVDLLLKIASEGGEYWMAEKSEVSAVAGDSRLLKGFELLAECSSGEYELWRIHG